MRTVTRTMMQITILFFAGTAFTFPGPGAQEPGVSLPDPETDGEISVEAALDARRSIRSFTDRGLSLKTLAQLSWAAQGVSDRQRGLRTAPSAGALYPLELYVAVGEVEDLARGLYRYLPDRHALTLERTGDLREALATAALGQTWIAEAPVVFVVVGIPERAEGRYGPRAERYTILEAGHVGQNIALQAVTRGLGTTVVGAFADQELRRLLELPANHHPLYIIPAGEPR